MHTAGAYDGLHQPFIGLCLFLRPSLAASNNVTLTTYEVMVTASSMRMGVTHFSEFSHVGVS